MANITSLNELVANLSKIGYGDIKTAKGKTAIILSDKKRQGVLADIAEKLDGKISTLTTLSSAGHVELANGFRVAVKPLSRQGRASAGVENEDNFVNALNYLLEQCDGCDVLLTDGVHKFLIKGAVKATSVGSFTSGRRKADVVVETTGKPVNISIKQDNAEYWESVDTYWREKALYFLKKAIAKKDISVKTLPNGVKEITPNLAIEATDDEAKDVIFGRDILKNGCVITRTFRGSDFNYKGKDDLITILCTSVITSLRDVPDGRKVFFLLRKDVRRRAISGFPGIRALATYKSRLTGNVKTIPLSKRNTY